MNNIGTDQPAHLCRLVCAFVVHMQKSGFLDEAHSFFLLAISGDIAFKKSYLYEIFPV